ncbi:MAG: ABC transporter permease [Vicinamibacteria bacterium]|nr:ABC transporter permease [Vicinamibacteria bacterium]
MSAELELERPAGPLAPLAPRSAGVPPALLLALAALASWEALSRAGVISPLYFPPPTRVLARLWREVTAGDLLSHAATTVRRVLSAVACFGLPGMLLGLAMGWSSQVRRAIDPLVAAVHPLPKVALFPLLLIVLGLGEAPLLVAAGLAAFFPCAISAMAGVDQIRPVHFEVARSCGAPPGLVLRRIVIPGALPVALAGLRLAFNTGLVVTLSSEMVGAETGLGAYLWLARETLRIENLYVGLLATAVLGASATALLRRVASSSLSWQQRRG